MVWNAGVRVTAEGLTEMTCNYFRTKVMQRGDCPRPTDLLYVAGD